MRARVVNRRVSPVKGPHMYLIKEHLRMLAILFIVFGFVPMAAFAQSDHEGQISLKVAVERAFENDPTIKIASTGRGIAKSALSEARAGWYPFLRFNQSFARSNNPVFVFGSLLEQGRFGSSNFALDALNQPSPLTNSRTLVGGQFSLFDQFHTSSRTLKARAGSDSAELREQALIQKTMFDVVRSYYGLILARERVRVAEDGLRSAQENFRRAKDMSEVGMITEADRLAAEVEVAMSEQRLVEARGGERIALADLNVRVGNRQIAELIPSSDLTERFFPSDDGVDLIALAFQNRPDWKMASLGLDVAKADVRMAQGGWLPRVDAFANYGYSAPLNSKGSSDYAYGLSITYDIFDAGRKARVDQAAGARSVAESQLDVERNRIRLEVITAEQNFNMAKARVQVLVKSAEQAAEALRISRDRYQNGLTTLTEVLRAEAALSNARQETLSARHDYFVAYAGMLLATGRLTLESIVD
jgi:outer membrane protein